MSRNYILYFIANDIALLELSEEVDLNVYTPACLPRPFQDFVGKKAWAYGMLNHSSHPHKLNIYYFFVFVQVGELQRKADSRMFLNVQN